MVPFICLTEVFKETAEALKETFLTAVCLAMVDLSRAFGHLGSAINHFVEAARLVINAIIDTMASLMSFVTRSVAAMFAIILAVIDDEEVDYESAPGIYREPRRGQNMGFFPISRDRPSANRGPFLRYILLYLSVTKTILLLQPCHITKIWILV